MRVLIQARRVWTAALFWPLWGITATLQLLDVVSVWLGSGAGRIHEVNPVLLAIEAHYGVLGALLVKALAIGAGLALVAGIYLLARRERRRILAALCLAIVAAGGVYSAAIFWNTIAALAAR